MRLGSKVWVRLAFEIPLDASMGMFLDISSDSNCGDHKTDIFESQCQSSQSFLRQAK
jgi:hypothetical protein